MTPTSPHWIGPQQGLPYPDRILPPVVSYLPPNGETVLYHLHHKTLYCKTLYFVGASGSAPSYKPPALDGGVRPKGIITAVLQCVFRSGPGDLVDRVSR